MPAHKLAVLSRFLVKFGNEPQRFLISSEIKCAHFHGTEVTKPIPFYRTYEGTAADCDMTSEDTPRSQCGEVTDRAVVPDPVQPDAAVLKEIGEVAFALAERVLCFALRVFSLRAPRACALKL